MDTLTEFMVLAPELSRMVKEFEEAEPEKETKHHEQYRSFQTTFAADTKALISSFKDFSNPFMEDSGQLFALDTGKVMSNDIVNSIKTIQQLGTEQYSTFSRDRISSQSISFDARIPNQQLPLMGYSTKPSKQKTQINALKQ